MAKIKMVNVRIAFPDLFEAKTVNGEGEAKFGAAFLFAPDHPARAAIAAGIKAVAAEKWGAKADEVLKSIIAKDNLCLHNGDTKSEYEGYAGNYFISARNKVRPTVIDRNKSPLTAADGRPYSGCYVTAVVELWAQDNKYGKRVNASLQGVQFYEDGDAFAGGTVASADDFDDLSEGAGAADLL